MSVYVRALGLFAALAVAGCVSPSAGIKASTEPAVATQPATQPAGPAALSWDAAKDHVGETITVTGPVIATHTTNDGSHVVLNVGKDYPDRTRLSIYMPADSSVASPDDTFKGKTVRVTGAVILFQNAAEIQTDMKKVEIQK